METSEIIKEVWNLEHWWQVAWVAVVDDLIFFVKLFQGFISWWYVWLILICIIWWSVRLRNHLKKKKKEEAARKKKTNTISAEERGI